MERLIYFDYNSTSPYSPSVKKYLQKEILEDWYNPSSIYLKARILDKKVRESRKSISEYLNCFSKHLFFTSGGTESINTILSLGTLKLNGLKSIITSPLEHHASLRKVEYSKTHIPIYYVNNNHQGEVDLNDLERLCHQNPKSLISLMSSNNETGVITDIKSVVKIAKRYHCLVHTDSVQSFGKTSVDLEDWNVDFASFSGHKIGSMKGVGLLYAEQAFAPLMYGGNQERGFRPGTYNFSSIYSLKLATQDIDLTKVKYIEQLRDYFEHEVKKLSPTFKVNCQKAKRLSNTSNIYFGGLSYQVVQNALMKRNIAVSSSSACNIGSPEPSPIIQALGFDKSYAHSCLRFSLSKNNTQKEIDFCISILKKLFLKNLSPQQNLCVEEGSGSSLKVHSDRIGNTLFP